MGLENIGQVSECQYLEVNINNKNQQEQEIKKRVSKYNRNGAMSYPVLRDEFVPRKRKVTIYEPVLTPITMYGSETWSLTTRTESQWQAAEMRELRLIVGVTRREN